MTRNRKTTPSTQKYLSQESVEQYLFGKSKEAIRNRTERQLLDDTFTGEALEGLSTQTSGRQMNANMNDLKARLQQRISQQKQKRGGAIMPFGMQPYAIAASIALILVCAVVVLFNSKYFQRTESAGNVAQAAKQAPLATNAERGIPEAAIASSDAQPGVSNSVRDEAELRVASEKTAAQPQVYKDETVGNTTGAAAPKIVSPETLKPSEPVVSSSMPTPSAETVVAMNEAKKADDKQNPVLLEEKMTAVPNEPVLTQANSVNREKARSSTPANAMKATAQSQPGATGPAKVIKGRVVDAEDGLPIPGTVVTVRGTTTSVYTNQNGEYTVLVPEGSELSFNFVGYITYRVPVEAQGVIDAKLSPDIKSLSEVVVIGADEKNGKTASNYQPAQPESGMPEFMKTIEQKLEASPYAESNASGVIKLSFTVEPDGTLTNVKVLKSLCPSCDQAAVQAVTEASRWKPAEENGKPVSQKMKIRVPFKAKKKDK